MESNFNLNVANFGFDAIISEGEHYFISYSRDDTNRIAPIAKAIHDKACQKCGRLLPFWYDRSGLKFGYDWEQQIIKSLKSCKAVIMFLTNELFQKEGTYMYREFQLAQYYKKTVYCVWLDKLEPKNIVSDKLVSWHFDLRALQGLECIPHETTDSISDRVVTMLFNLPVPPPRPIPFLEKYKNIIILTLAAVAVVAVLTFAVIVPAIKNIFSGGGTVDYGTNSIPEGTTTQDDKSIFDNSSATISVSRVGQTITLGTYEQDNITSNGSEPIEWTVLEIRDNTALIITRYGIDNPQFNTSKTNTTWADSNLRRWMNNTFYNSAFSSQEKQVILEVNVSSEDSLKWGTNGGSSTKDKIFALSESETNKYFSGNGDRQTLATNYAESNGAMVSTDFFMNGKGTTWWWLRNPGSHENEASYISGKGSIASYGAEVNSKHACARPAMWIAVN